jgi:hypothetical protein
VWFAHNPQIFCRTRQLGWNLPSHPGRHNENIITNPAGPLNYLG